MGQHTAHYNDHHDEPSLLDLADRGKLLKEIAATLAEADPPRVFGIHGDWGSGKTSFLHQLQYELTGECSQNLGCEKKTQLKVYKHITAVWFEAWRYQNEPAPVIALLHEIRAQLAGNAKVLKNMKAFGELGLKGFLRAFEEITWEVGDPLTGSKIGGKFNNPYNTVSAASEERKQKNLAETLATKKIRDFLNEAINKLIGKKTNGEERLIIFIDDLDRCQEEAIFRLLEGIKIYLNIPSCIFVLGINQREIERAVASHLPSAKKDEERESDVNPRAQEYVEKICNFVWKLPILSPVQQAKMVEKWLEPIDPKTLRDQICNVIRDYEVLPANPRKIKAFCNAILQLIRYRESHLDIANAELIAETEASAIVLAACLYQFHPRLIRYLQAYPDFFEALKKDARDGFPVEGTDDVGPLKPTHIFPQGATGSPAPIFIDPADGSYFRCQRLLVEGGLKRNDIAPYLGMTLV